MYKKPQESESTRDIDWNHVKYRAEHISKILKGVQ